MAYKPGNGKQDGSGDEGGTPEKEGAGFAHYIKEEATLLADVGVPTTSRFGTPIDLDLPAVAANPTVVAEEVTLPGVGAITYVSTMGKIDQSSPGDSAINIAAQKIFRAIQKELRQRNLPWQKVDVMKLLAAVSDLSVAMRDLRRAVRFVSEAQAGTRYNGRALVSACGYDYDDLEANLPAIAATTHVWAETAKSWVFPKFCDYFTNQDYLVDNLFLDSLGTRRTQCYVFVPQYLRYHDETVVPSQIALRPFHQDLNVKLSWLNVKTIINELIEKLDNSTAFDIINGAIAATFPESEKVEFVLSTFSEKVESVYDGEILMAIENALFMPKAADYADLFQPADRGHNMFESKLPLLGEETPFATNRNMPTAFNTYTATTTRTHFALYSRWRSWAYWNGTPGAFTDYTFGTEILTAMWFFDTAGNHFFFPGYIGTRRPGVDIGLYDFRHSVGNYQTKTYSGDITTDAVPILEELFRYLQLITIISNFDHHPILYYAFEMKDTTNGTPLMMSAGTIANWHFNGRASIEDIGATHAAALWYQFVDTLKGTNID